MAKGSQKKEWLKHEIAGVGLIALGVLLIVGLLTWPSGWISDFVVELLRGLVGNGAYLFSLILSIAGVRLMRRNKTKESTLFIYGAWLLLITVVTFLHLRVPLESAFFTGLTGTGGGLIGALFSYLLQVAFGQAGAVVILIALTVVAILLLTNVSLLTIGAFLFQGVKRILSGGWRKLKGAGSSRAGRSAPSPRVTEEMDAFEKNDTAPIILDLGKPVQDAAADGGGAPGTQGASLAEEGAEGKSAGTGGKNKADREQGEENSRNWPAPGQSPGLGKVAYQLPPLSVLAKAQQTKSNLSNKDISANIQKLEETLESFGINAKVNQVSRGPAITRYELQPPPGVKVSKITGLADDIALSMAASGVRIEAPIPGKAAIGIEIPNKETSMVQLRELLETGEFANSTSKLTISLGKDIAGNAVVADMAKMPHMLVAGATGSGKSVCINTLIVSILFKATPDEVKFLMIDPKMVELTMYNGIPHLVSPVVIDPKKAASSLRWAVREMEHRYELFAEAGVRDITGYNQMIREEEALMSLERSAEEPPPGVPDGEKRLPDQAGSGLDDGQQSPVNRRRQPYDDEGWTGSANRLPLEDRYPGDSVVTTSLIEEQPDPDVRKPLPLMVIIIDELADLMMVAPADVEDAICRLAQMARAAGIHLLVATQRPSVDVITGLIKANIPSRISFAVSSQIDSRTILDMTGAEKLLGKGDMLFYPVGVAKPLRVQGAFLADKEVESLVSFLSNQGKPVYNEQVTEVQPDKEEIQEDEDELLPQAVEILIESGHASISLLQRRLRIGYARAARLIDVMERKRIVGGYEGSKPRAILMTMEQFQQVYTNKN